MIGSLIFFAESIAILSVKRKHDSPQGDQQGYFSPTPGRDQSGSYGVRRAP